MRISAEHQKFLVAFGNENLFVKPANFGAAPAAIFASPIDIEKLINAEGSFL
jgi:hypothetical protein